MTYAGSTDDTADVTRTGGLPLVPEGFVWPQCSTHEAPMMFVAQLRLEDLASSDPSPHAGAEGLLAIWVCQNDPGDCDSWDPLDGANTAQIYGGPGLTPAAAPKTGVALRPASSAVTFQRIDAEGYDEARTAWAKSTGESPRKVLGGLGGEPSWLQGEEVPACPSCERPMDFAAHLEEGQDHVDEVNFGGGGCGYAFLCRPCAEAAFVWQC